MIVYNSVESLGKKWLFAPPCTLVIINPALKCHCPEKKSEIVFLLYDSSNNTMFVKLSAYTVCENSCQLLKPLLNHAQLLSAEIPGFVAPLFCAAFTDKSQLFCFNKPGITATFVTYLLSLGSRELFLWGYRQRKLVLYRRI